MLRKKNITLQGKKADGSEKVETGDSIRLTTRYYDSNGKEITGPVTLKVNEEILVVNELTSKTKFSGLITVENKIPANAVLLKVYSGDDEKLLKGIISGSLGYQEVSKGDTGFVSSVRTDDVCAGSVPVTAVFVVSG